MSLLLRILLLVVLSTLTFSQPGQAQVNPTWRNDALGRPAPPCMTLDPTTGASTPCPAPAGSGLGPAGGTTVVASGGQTTAFGNTWFTGGPIETAPNAGLGCVFLSDTALNCVGQQAGNATNIRVYQSTNGGVTLPLAFTTGSTPGNLNTTGQLVRSAAGPYYLGLDVNGATGNNPLRSVDLNVWTATSGVNIAPFAPTGTSRMAVGGPSGNTILAVTSSSTARVCRLVAPASAFTCSAPAGFGGVGGATNPLHYVGGSTWLLIDATGVANVFRSTDDGASWTVVATLTGTKSGIGQANLTCTTTQVCLAHVGSSVYRSTDAGSTWTLVLIGDTDFQALVNFGSGNVMILGSFLASPTPNPGCLPNCQNIQNEAVRTIDGGVTWVSAAGPWLTIAGTGGNYTTTAARANGTAVVTHSSVNNGPTNAGRNYGYTTSLPGGLKVLSRGEIPTIPVQGGSLLNSQTTGAANTAVVVTLTGVAGFRVHLYDVEARCSAGTATLTVQDGATTIWSRDAASITTANFVKGWNPGLTFADGSNAVITLGACGVGNTGTLIIQADQF